MLTAREIGRGCAGSRRPSRRRRRAAGEDDWGAFSRLGGLIALRSGVYFGLQAFIPAYFVVELSSSEAAGNAALTIMLAAGAVGTLVGGGLVDRWGARAVLVGHPGAAPAAARRAAAGRRGAGATIAARPRSGSSRSPASRSPSCSGQAYLPNRMGLASGVTLGLAIGLGGVAATALGVIADAAGLHAVLWTIAVLPAACDRCSRSACRPCRRRASAAQPEVLQRREPGDDDGLERDPHLADGSGVNVSSASTSRLPAAQARFARITATTPALGIAGRVASRRTSAL